MTAPQSELKVPLIVGVNHHSGGLSLRDRLFVEDAEVPSFLTRLRDAGLDQGMVVSTCDRIEIVSVSALPEKDAGTMIDVLAGHGGVAADDVRAASYRFERDAAVRHMFRVASSLDSVIIGEPQVLGQVKACHRMARELGMVSGDLEALMQASYGAAKKIRTETAIGERPVSIAAVAVGIARDVHGDLPSTVGLVMGAGDMGELIGRELMRAGMTRLMVIDAGRIGTQALADQLGAQHLPADVLASALAEADVIVSAVGGRDRPLRADMVRAALKVRRNRPQFIVDASLPSDVEPAVDRIDDAFLYDLGDLERLALEGQANRKLEAETAAGMIEGEVAAFLRGRQERSAAPALSAFRGHVAELRRQVLIEAGDDAERATHLLMQRLLHAPSVKLRELAANGQDIETFEQTLRDLFDISKDGDETP